MVGTVAVDQGRALRSTGQKSAVTLTAVLLAFIVLAFDGTLIGSVYALSGPPEFNDRHAVVFILASDASLLAVIWLLMRSTWSQLPRERERQLLKWYIVGGGLYTLADCTWTLIPDQAAPSTYWYHFAVEPVYTLSLAAILAAVVDAVPRSQLKRSGSQGGSPPSMWFRYRPAIPLLIGIFAAYIAMDVYAFAMYPSGIWTFGQAAELATRSGLIGESSGLTAGEEAAVVIGLCRSAVDQQYFAQLSQIIPLLIVAVGVEAGFFRKLLDHPLHRAITIVTVASLAVAELLAIMILTKSNNGCGDLISPAFEVTAFVFTIEATVVSLSTLIWALVAPRDSKHAQGQ